MELNQRTRAARVIRPAGLVAALMIATSAAAQPARDECPARLERARGQYQEQQFAEVERLIVECVDRHLLPATDMDEGFRLLTLAYLRENLLAEAQATVIKHLAWSFTYEPDEVRDPPLYVALVRIVKAQLTVPSPALLASTAPVSAPETTPGSGAVPIPEPIAEPPIEATIRPAAEPAGQSAGEPTTIPADDPVDEPVRQPAVARVVEPLNESADEAVGEPAVDPGSEPVDEPVEEPSPEDPGRDPVALRASEPDAQPATLVSQLASNTVLDSGPASEEARAVISGESPEPSRATRDSRYGGGLAASGTDHSSLRLPMPAGSGSEKVDPYNETLDFATAMPEIVGGPDAIQLVYPDFERRAAIGGRVVVRFVVDLDGRVVEPEIVRGVGPGLDAAALDALRRLRFRPARQNGQPARVRMTLTFNFDAASGSAGY